MAEPSYTPNTTPEAKDYTPSTKEQATVSVVENAFLRGRTLRRPHEPQWFVNSAFDRGNHYVVWAEGRGLVVPPAPPNRIRLTVNLVGPINRARASKFLRNRPVPLTVPATGDVEDRQNARASTLAMSYQTRRLRLEQAYNDAVRTAQLMGHGYWWFSWNPDVPARVKVTDPFTGQPSIEEIQGVEGAGDIELEVDSPWSVLVGDPSIHFIGNQPWIIRLKMRSLDYIRSRFSEKGKYVAGEAGQEDALRYQEQVATLNAQGFGGTGLSEARESQAPENREGQKTSALVKEYFELPCPDYPKGRYLVVAGGVLLKEAELPHAFSDMPNPYPVADFTDTPRVGQYWIPTICEQMIPVQKEYNLLRSKLAEHMRMLVHPKVFVAKQHLIPQGAYTSEAGEMIEYFAVPHLPPPTVVTPSPISADIWRCFELLRKEMYDIAHIYPESEGQIAGSESGYQTNLLQEAADATHRPDVDAHSAVLAEAYYKIRRMMKVYYGVERLLTIAGKDMEPEAFEFSRDHIDDYADIIMLANSALPALPSAKSQMILEYWKAGVYGPADDPEARRKVVNMLEMGTADDMFQDARRDEQQARVENTRFLDGEALPIPEFYENHDLHYKTHTDLLKSPRQWDPMQKRQLIAHTILHVKYQNPQSAIMLAQQYGMPDLVADLLGGPLGAPTSPAASGAPPMGPGMPAGPLPPGMPPGGAGAPNPAMALMGGGMGPAPSASMMSPAAPMMGPGGPAMMGPDTVM